MEDTDIFPRSTDWVNTSQECPEYEADDFYGVCQV